MIAYNDALKTIRETALSLKLETENVPLSEATGRVCADGIAAGLDIQPFDNSAMDGFAVRIEDLAAADAAHPVSLVKSGIIGAGEDASGIALEKGACWHVMTGAPLPAGTEAVVPIENVLAEKDRITFKEQPVKGQNIRYAGEDFKKGDLLLSAGEKIMPAHILPLATAGVASISVFRKPKILLIPTGAEIIDDLAAPLSTGQIYNSNKFYAESFLKEFGIDITVHETIRDNLEHFAEALAKAKEEKYDLVVSFGAVSAGSFDFVKEGLEKSGAQILYHKIKLKPGKPNLLAVLPSGALYFGLPGNPVATAVGLRFFVTEALRVLYGQKPETPFYARAINSFSKKSGLHMILKGRIDYRDDGSVAVEIMDGQESFKVGPFLRMNCWAHVSEGQETVKPGDVVEIYPLLP